MALQKTSAEIDLMRESGHRLARVLARVKQEVRSGITTISLDEIAHDLIKQEGGIPAFLGYKPAGAKKAYPAVSCISVNDIVVHGVPGSYTIQEGDVVKIDLGLVYKGWYSDAAVSVAVGDVSSEVKTLLSATEQSLMAGIKAARVGNTLGDIGFAVQSVISKHGFGIVQALTGHGIGRKLHEEPWVYNVGLPGKGEPLLPGMVIAIEPMIALGSGDVRQLKDDSFATKDGSVSAHFEHTVAITEQGPEVLTRLDRV